MGKDNWIVWVYWQEWWNCYLCEHYWLAHPKTLICGEGGTPLIATMPMYTLEDIVAAVRLQGLRYVLCPQCAKAEEDDEEGDSTVIVRDTGEVLRQGTRPIDEAMLKHIIFAELAKSDDRSLQTPKPSRHDNRTAERSMNQALDAHFHDTDDEGTY